MFSSFGSMLLLAFGFGFVIFFHELGHFLAAKWADVKVEQFAVGFGQAMFSWRKGLGFSWGSTATKLEEAVHAEREKHAADTQRETDDQVLSRLGISETEYRLNWIPLGGYVKMLGQDDLKPGATANDPRAYNNKTVGARMVIVSAGVIMNIILAAVGFMVVFLIGFNTQPPVVGAVMPGSPAALTTKLDGTAAPLQVGDRILMFDDKWQHSFDKIQLNVALSGEGNVPMYVERLDGTKERLNIKPATSDSEASDFLLMGIGPTLELRGLDPAKVEDDGEMPIAERFALIQAQADEARDQAGGASLATLAAVAAALPTSLVTRLARQQAQTVDFATSNVRGSPLPVYISGAQLLENYPVGPLAGVAFNLTLLSYLGSLDMGLNIDAAAVAEPERLAAALRRAFKDLGRA